MPSRDAKAPFSHQCVGSTKDEWRDGAIPLGGVRNSPSAAVAGGRRKDSKSRRRDRSRNPRREWTSSGESLAGSARSKSHGKIRIFRKSGLHGSCRHGARGLRRSGSWYGEGPEGVHDSPLHASGTWKVRRDGLHIGKWSVVQGEADRGVGGTSVERSEMTETGQGPEIAEAGPALFAPMDGEGLGAQVATLAGELVLDPPARPMEV